MKNATSPTCPSAGRRQITTAATRPGANLFGNSLVAVDLNTGKYKWHFQTVHHDLWDFDMPPAPGLMDVTVNGKKIPALAQVGKTSWMFILDRTTGTSRFSASRSGPFPRAMFPVSGIRLRNLFR